MATEDKRTLRDLLRERHERGAAVLGGRIRPDGEGGLVIDRYEPRSHNEQEVGRHVIPTNDGGDRL